MSQAPDRLDGGAYLLGETDEPFVAMEHRCRQVPEPEVVLRVSEAKCAAGTVVAKASMAGERHTRLSFHEHDPEAHVSVEYPVMAPNLLL